MWMKKGEEEEEEVGMDEKAKRMRDLLSSFYSTDPSAVAPPPSSASLDTINTASFDADQYMNLLMQKSNLEGLLQRHAAMAAEIKNLDTDLQMLVYENYNKFISATDTIKRMNSNIVGMESNMEQLLEKIMSVQSRSDGVNTSLFEKREHIEKLHRTRTLLRKVQFIYDLPARLEKCITSEDYSNAVKFYTGAIPIFKAYGDSSFQDCKKASEEAIAIVTKNLQGKLFLDSESIQARAEAAMLLKQLNFPVDSLKAKLLEKLEQSLDDLQLESKKLSTIKNEVPEEGNIPDSFSSVHEASTRGFVEALRAYRAIFPDSEAQLIRLAQELISKHFETTQKQIKVTISPTDLLEMLGVIWNDVVLIDEVLPEAAVSEFSFKAARVTVKQYIDGKFSHLLHGISDAVTSVQSRPKEGIEGYSLQSALDASKTAVTEGSIDILQSFQRLLDDNLGLLMKLRGLIIDWVQEGFQEFFRKLDEHFLFLSRKTNSTGQSHLPVENLQKDRILSGLVLVLAQLSNFIEQNSVPRITEEIAAAFSGGGVRGYEHGPAFVPAEICRMFRAASEKFLNLYISMRTQKISALLRKRFTTPNWVKHKEPREVHMFVELLLQELQEIRNEVTILPQGLRKHRRTDSNGSTTSSRSNPLRDSNTQRGRSQLLETHLAKLFKQKMEIFTKVEHTQESVVTTIIKLCLKSLQEFVRLQTFNRSGFQQIQLDIQFIKSALRDSAEDEAAVEFLLDEVIVAAAERCLDPTPLEPPILDKLIQAKLAKTFEHNRSPSS